MTGLRTLLLFAVCLLGVGTSSTYAGGGPENVLVVVNQNSDASKTIANYYIRFRKIPPLNVVYLDWQGDLDTCSGEEFREEILKPLFAAISDRKLVLQIDYIVYSADFPWRVHLKEDLAGENLPKQFSPTASLTGATYLWPYVLRKQGGLVMPNVNWYVPSAPTPNLAKCQSLEGIATRGFRARDAWTRQHERASNPTEGQRYLISSMLGITVEGGNSVEEVIAYLRRSAQVDAQRPTGTFYFMKRNGKPRSAPRHDCYQGIVDALKAAGAQAEVRDGDLPENASQVLGLMTGVRQFDLAKSNVQFMPGAFADNLTSYGGDFSNNWQTKLSAPLRAGAAGSSGTVTEPFALQAKFPLPSLHLHYFRGCSLGEAFYQSVSGPYQQLLVGDPLCQPWARPPRVEVEGIEPGGQYSQNVELRSKITPRPGTKVATCELFVDGRLVVPEPFPQQLPVPLELDQLSPGHHELRLVATTDDPLAMQGRVIVPFEVGSGEEPAVAIRVVPSPVVARGATIEVEVEGPAEATAIDILQNRRVVAQVQGRSGKVRIDPQLLGSGPVALAAEVTMPAELAAPAGGPPRSREYWLLVKE